MLGSAPAESGATMTTPPPGVNAGSARKAHSRAVSAQEGCSQRKQREKADSPVFAEPVPGQARGATD